MNLSETIFSYDSATGTAAIRTINEAGTLYFSLFDVVRAISAENRVLAPDRPSKSLITLIRAHATHLLPDEIKTKDNLPSNIDEPLRESYVTKSGLLRVVLQDKSPACIKFQKWVLDDVLPSVLEKGSYVHPSVQRGSGSSMSTEGMDVEQILMIQLQEARERKQADAALKSEVNNITIEVDQIRRVVGDSEYLLVREHHIGQSLSEQKQWELFVHCLNLSSNNSAMYKSNRLKEGTDIDSKAFTIKTIEAALALLKST
ncbi:hypothetical protein RA805_003504 [Vibrio cholerae]|uniref:BRO-N domain-containing protein n=1 Tax=Vibrio cholerae TaxID=666 RepID=UPI000B2D63DF|nr:BRO family protein [Vibrio cholerae]EJL6579345.1 hypothetical protein [Vibrio cholerae]ELF6478211.1 hypothetical protein [Vibrio cholerae]MBJ6973526.1 hypothetical protein [Vibrio cholerae]MCR9706637.1 BRO family protein [Vibrio cholerae]BCK29710.1 hypothetical protein VCSRO77_3125 [Vibrio cholerae]